MLKLRMPTIYEVFGAVNTHFVIVPIKTRVIIKTWYGTYCYQLAFVSAALIWLTA